VQDISDIRSIAIIGTGLQGHAIAQVALMAGFSKVILNDLSRELIDKAVSTGFHLPGPFAMGKKNYKQLVVKLDELAELTVRNYLKPCKLMRSGGFLGMKK